MRPSADGPRGSLIPGGQRCRERWHLFVQALFFCKSQRGWIRALCRHSSTTASENGGHYLLFDLADISLKMQRFFILKRLALPAALREFFFGLGGAYGFIIFNFGIRRHH